MDTQLRFKYDSSTTGLVIDIRVCGHGDNMTVLNVQSGDLSAYMDAPSGSVKITVSQTGTGKNILVAKGNLEHGKYTAMVSIPARFQLFKDRDHCPKSGTALVRSLPSSPSYTSIRPGTSVVRSMNGTTFSAISGGIYTVFDSMDTTQSSMYVPMGVASNGLITSGMMSTNMVSYVSHDNNASTAAPSQECEVVVDDFNLGKFSGLWYQVACTDSTSCAHASVVYTPLHTHIRVLSVCYDSQWGKITSSNSVATMPRESQLAVVMNNTTMLVSSPSGAPTVVSNGSTTMMTVLNPVATPANSSMDNTGMTNSSTTGTLTTPVLHTVDNVNQTVHYTDYTSYALVGSPTRTTMCILTRSRCEGMDRDTYDRLLAKASKLGYDTGKLRKDESLLRDPGCTDSTPIESSTW